MKSRSLIGLVAAFCGFGAAADPAAPWHEPFTLALPEAARTVLLRPGADVRGVLARHAIADARVVSGAARTTIVELRRSEAEWARMQQGLCTDAEVARCETSLCQRIALAGSVQGGSPRKAESITARLVQEPPLTLPAPPGGDAGTCRGPPLLPPLESTPSAATPDATLELRPLSRNDGAGGGDADSGGAESDPQGGTAVRYRRSFAFAVESRPGATGGITLVAEQLPDDTSDWRLLVAADCSELSIPLDSLAPAREPGRIAALVAGGASAAVAQAHALSVVREVTLDVTGETLTVFATGGDVDQTIAALAADARISGAQPEFVYRTAAQPAAPYDDPYASFAYGPEQIGARRLHPAARGAGALVAVIDTGIDLEHPDLRDRIRRHADTTGGGWSADLHGTAIAGIIAANANNGEGSYGVAPDAELVALKACEPKEPGSLAAKCWTSSLVKALDIAIGVDAGIINLSLTGPPDALVARHVQLALDRGRLVVAAAGNGGAYARPGFPAALPGVMAATAVDVAAQPWRDANRGDYIDVAAPGVDIVAPAPGGDYPPLSGTSMAAAHVSGVAALIRGIANTASAEQVTRAIDGTVRDLGPAGRDASFGDGLIDACAAAATIAGNAAICGGADALPARAD